jgi:hypothetical protein
MNPDQSCFMRATPSSRTFMTTAGSHNPLGPVGVAGNLKHHFNCRVSETGGLEGQVQSKEGKST